MTTKKVWLPDTDGWTDRQKPDKEIPMCRCFACTQKMNNHVLVYESIWYQMKLQNNFLSGNRCVSLLRKPLLQVLRVIIPEHHKNPDIDHLQFWWNLQFVYFVVKTLNLKTFSWISLWLPWKRFWKFEPFSNYFDTLNCLKYSKFKKHYIYTREQWKCNTHMYINISRICRIYFHRGLLVILWIQNADIIF